MLEMLSSITTPNSSQRRSLSYRNQSTGLLYKSMDWSLYDRDLRHERVNLICATSFFLNPIKRPVALKGLNSHSRRSGVFIVDFEHISHLFLVFLLLGLNN